MQDLRESSGECCDAVAEQSREKNPYVKILTKIKNKKLLIEISNTYTNEIQRKEDRFYSTKHGGFGIGLHL